ELWQRGGELNGDAVQRRFRNAIRRRPTVSAIDQLSAAAGNIHNPGRVALFQKWNERLRNQERAERVGAQRRFENRRCAAEHVFVSLEQNPGVVYERVETIALFSKFFRRGANAFRIANINQEKTNGSCVLAFLIQFIRRRFPGFLITCTEKYAEPLAPKLPRHFKSDSLIRSGDERDASLSCHATR